MVIMMRNNWMNKYHNRDEFLTWFNDEQEYVDNMFVQIVMFNYGVWVDKENLRTDETRRERSNL
jgi:hypothetical protein